MTNADESRNGNAAGDYARLEEPRRGKYPEPVVCGWCPCDMLPFIMLVFIMWLSFGSYWVMDTPGAIQKELTDWFGGNETYTDADNTMLYSVYSFPNMILCLFGGFIVDRVTGIRAGAIIFVGLILLGELIFAMGVQQKIYWLAVVGRFVFGMGGESLCVAQNSFVVSWFEGPALALAFGAVVAFSRIGSAVNFLVTPKMAKQGVPFSIWFGVATCGISMLMAVLAAFTDWYGRKRLEARRARMAKEDMPKLSEVKNFPLQAWLLMFICAFFYVCVVTFNSVASKIMQQTGRHYESDEASQFLAIPNFMAIVLSPLFGRMIDRVGRALNFILLASVLMVGVHVLFFLLAIETIDVHPGYIMGLLGFSYSLGASSIMPILAVVVDQRLCSTAYGMMTAIQNSFMALAPLAIGNIMTIESLKPHKIYTVPILIFIGCAGASILLTLVLLSVDKARGGRMNASSAKRAEMDALAEENTTKLSPGASDGFTVNDYASAA